MITYQLPAFFLASFSPMLQHTAFPKPLVFLNALSYQARLQAHPPIAFVPGAVLVKAENDKSSMMFYEFSIFLRLAINPIKPNPASIKA